MQLTRLLQITQASNCIVIAYMVSGDLAWAYGTDYP